MLATAGRRLLSRGSINRTVPVLRATLSSTFNERERGEEARYFREDDERKKRALREKMDAVLALDDSHADKQQLMKLLGKA